MRAVDTRPWRGSVCGVSDSTTTAPIKVVIVDDHELVRGGLETILGLFDDIQLVGQAESGAAAVRVCGELQPDVVLMDLVMPGDMDGAEATEQLLLTCPGARVLALTSFSDPELIQRVLRAGALGCLLKNVSGKELATAIRRAHEGSSTLAPEAADALVQAMASPTAARTALTRREHEVLELMVEGLTNAEIADRLVVSLSTVKTHVSSIIAKLGASTRTEAATIAVREHLA
jgi:two-component system, NarL family, response regulator LiaR